MSCNIKWTTQTLVYIPNNFKVNSYFVFYPHVNLLNWTWLSVLTLWMLSQSFQKKNSFWQWNVITSTYLQSWYSNCTRINGRPIAEMARYSRQPFSCCCLPSLLNKLRIPFCKDSFNPYNNVQVKSAKSKYNLKYVIWFLKSIKNLSGM